MITRAKNGISKPKIFLSNHTVDEPNNIQEALLHDNWRTVVHEKYNALSRNQTWSLVPLPSNKRAVISKWVFKLKRHPDGSGSRTRPGSG